MNTDFPDLEDEFTDREFRQTYVDNRVRRFIAYQLRALREDRDLSQQELAEISGMKQTALSRLENPEYGRPSVTTLLKVAAAYDVALLVRFVDYATFLKFSRDLSSEALRVSAYAESLQGLPARPAPAQKTLLAVTGSLNLPLVAGAANSNRPEARIWETNKQDHPKTYLARSLGSTSTFTPINVTSGLARMILR